MPSSSFNIRISWKGDAEKGKAMERILRDVFESEYLEDPVAKTLAETLSKQVWENPEQITRFGEASFPRTMEFRVEETRANPETARPYIFEAFPKLQFRLQIINEDEDEYHCLVYNKGKPKKEILEAFESWEKYDQDLYKWLAPEVEEALAFDETLQYIPAKNWKDEGFCKNAVTRNGRALE
ncbi:hypothetical protein Holit_02602 [Hollandina sp. SP2]